ncbi:hypothetical protein LguiB_005767 [Lonicera macranthoides]
MAKEAQVAVVVVPFPAQGHLNQLLQFSCIISTYKIPVHFVGSATHSRQAKLRATGLNPLDIANIHFHEFPTPHFPSPPPNPNVSIKFPAHLQPSFDASLHLRKPVYSLLREVADTARRVIVIHDPLAAFVIQDAALIPNAESYVFNCVSAFNQFLKLWEGMGRPFEVENVQKVLPSPIHGCVTFDMINFAVSQRDLLKKRAGDIYNSSRLVEGTYLDLLAKEIMSGDKKQWAIGPVNPVKINPGSSKTRHKCLDWLDQQELRSVIYVSFGTTVSMTDEEIKELAMGLERSEQKFLWVLRDADKGDIFEGEVRRYELPEGYEERVEGVGMVVRDWAPQLEILAHTSTGGFMSHCGWNSCTEAITYGVPILTWPMHSDQPRIAILITKVLGIGLVLREWEHRKEVVRACSIEKSVKRLTASKEGEEIKKRIEQLGSAIRQSKDEGGISRVEMDSFIDHITR